MRRWFGLLLVAGCSFKNGGAGADGSGAGTRDAANHDGALVDSAPGLDGSGSGSGSAVPATLTLTGTVFGIDVGSGGKGPGIGGGGGGGGGSFGPLANATVIAEDAGDTALDTTMSGSDGSYTLTVTTNGSAFTGHIHVQAATFLDTYDYPAAPLVADESNILSTVFTSGTVQQLTQTCGETQNVTNNGFLALEVVASGGQPMGGATVASLPGAGRVCYDGNMGFPDGKATTTANDGIAYVIDEPVNPNVVVSASVSGTTFGSHGFPVKANTVTGTLISQ